MKITESKCENCSGLYQIHLIIPTELWEKINDGRKYLCGVCIIKAIEKMNVMGDLIARHHKYQYRKVKRGLSPKQALELKIRNREWDIERFLKMPSRGNKITKLIHKKMLELMELKKQYNETYITGKNEMK